MRTNKQRFFAAAAATLIYALAVTAAFRYFYFINDDLIIRDILSGRYSGVADAHIFNLIYPFAWLVKLAYQIVPQVDAWGVLLVGLIYLCLFAILYRSLGLAKKRWLAVIGCVYVVFSCATLYHTSLITFTATGTICAETALFLFITKAPGDWRLRTYLPSLLLMLAAFCIRKDTLVMLLPFFGLWMLYLFLTDRDRKKNIGKMLRPVIALGLCCAALWGAHVLAYTDASWQDFLEFRSLRKAVHDFSGYPEYESNTELYDSIGISYEEYRSIATGSFGGGNTVLDYSAGIRDILREIGTYTKEERANQSAADRLRSGIEKIATLFWFRTSLYLTVALGLLITVCLSAILIKRKRWLLLAALLCGYLGAWMELLLLGYLGRVTRVVLRLQVALQMIWPLVVAVYLFGVEKMAYSLTTCRERILSAAVLCLCVLTLGSWMTQTKQDSKECNIQSQTTWDIYNYCKSNPENAYFQPALAISRYSGFPLARFDCEFNNLVILGGWNAFSPEYQQSLVTMGVDSGTIEESILSQDNVYVISNEQYMRGILDYFQWKYGDAVSWEIVDSLGTVDLRCHYVYDFSLSAE